MKRARSLRRGKTAEVANLLRQATALQRKGNLDEAEQRYQAVLHKRPDHFDALHLLGVLRAQRGKFEEAVRLIRRAIDQKSQSVNAHFNLGNALWRFGHPAEAISSYDRALAIKLNHVGAHHNRGVVLAELGRYEEAIAAFERVRALKPGHIEALHNCATALATLGRHEDAIRNYDKILVMRPDYPEILNNRGVALAHLDRHEEAIASYDRALKVRPDYPEAMNNRGAALAKLNHYEEAVASYDKVIRVRPNYAEAHNNRGAALAKLNRHEEAIESYRKALAIRPDYPEALSNYGAALTRLSRFEEAVVYCGKALTTNPSNVDALSNRHSALARLNRHEEALASLEKALSIQPGLGYALGAAIHSRAHVCDWKDYDQLKQRLLNNVRAQKLASDPFAVLAITDDLADQLTCAVIGVRDKCPPILPPLWDGVRYKHDRIRVAYLSADFHEHATAYLIAELFERHDRERFEVTGVSFGPDVACEMRARIKRAFERFVDVRQSSDREVAALLHEMEIDIAVDLKGFTTDSRTGILAFRPAPIQVNYLGYPGTMGAEYIDYILADRVVIPEEHHRYYTEKVVYLPDCYQVNDSKRSIASRTPTRAQAGLPEQGFVFCCFNNNYKITPAVFDVWMRLLHKVEGSVLWLLKSNPAAARNLRREAQTRGVDPKRLVFASRAKLPDHLARHRLADLFLDTLPYNAHTTASDALWAGLPVITCLGTTFAGRVAASLLQAIGLPELITHSMAEYEVLALKLATESTLLREIKEKLAKNRLSTPLFDTERFTRHIEAAYTTMWEICQRGEVPRTFAVTTSANPRLQ